MDVLAQVDIFVQGRFQGPAILSTAGSTERRKDPKKKIAKLQLEEGKLNNNARPIPVSIAV